MPVDSFGNAVEHSFVDAIIEPSLKSKLYNEIKTT